jgi:hypothetical protein
MGTSVTLTAQVAADSSGILPTGTVRFEVAGTAITGCEAVPVSSGRASCMSMALPPGSLRLVATYSGDATYLAGSAEATNYVVQGEAAASADSTLPDTGADVDALLLGALLLILTGGALVAFTSPGTGRRGFLGQH